MSITDKDKTLATAIEIGDFLISNAVFEDGKMHWPAVRFISKTSSTYTVSETIYSGSSGIILFFLELHHATQTPKYLDIIKFGSNWLVSYCNANPSDNASFYTGRLGVAYTLMKVYEVNGDQSLKKAAYKIAKNCLQKEKPLVDDLLAGHAGGIIGLMFLYKYFDEVFILESLDYYVNMLISSANLSFKEGVSWGRNTSQVKNLCGFSHGTAGIAFAFNELRNFLNNESFSWFADQAIFYENNQFDSSNMEWPDFRQEINEAVNFNAKEMMSTDSISLNPPGFNYWCHGANGIGLSRLRAYIIQNKDSYLQDFFKADEILRSKPDIGNYSQKALTLCHGLSGDVLFFLESFYALNKPEYFDIAGKIASQIRENFALPSDSLTVQNNKTDFSLFLGISGIGYMFLKLLNFKASDNILCPKIEDIKCKTNLDSYSYLRIEKIDIIKSILERNFPQTFNFMSENAWENSLHIDNNIRLPEIYESIKKMVVNNPYFNARFMIEEGQNKHRNGNYLLNEVIRLSHDRIMESYNGLFPIKNLSYILSQNINIYVQPDKDEDKPNSYCLLRRDSPNVILIIPEICYHLFEKCRTQSSYNDIFYFFDLKYKINSVDDFEKYLIGQLSEAIKNRILIPSSVI